MSLELELDDRFFEVIASSPTAIMTKHRISGTLNLWQLDWRERGDYPTSFEAEAWAAYLRAMAK